MPIYTVKLGPVKGEGGKVFSDGDRIELSPEEAQPMLDLKVIELVEAMSSEINPPLKTVRTKPAE